MSVAGSKTTTSLTLFVLVVAGCPDRPAETSVRHLQANSEGHEKDQRKTADGNLAAEKVMDGALEGG